MGYRIISALAVLLMAALSYPAAAKKPSLGPVSAIVTITPSAPRAIIESNITVQFIYFVPADRTVSPRYVAAVRSGVAQLGTWYAEQLNGGRMRFSATGLITCKASSPHPILLQNLTSAC